MVRPIPGVAAPFITAGVMRLRPLPLPLPIAGRGAGPEYEEEVPDKALSLLSCVSTYVDLYPYRAGLVLRVRYPVVLSR
jgi:hypothetical protein